MTSEAPFNNRKNVHILDASIDTFSNANELAPRSFGALSLLIAPRCVLRSAKPLLKPHYVLPFLQPLSKSVTSLHTSLHQKSVYLLP